MLRPAQKGKQRYLTTVRDRPTRNKALFYYLKARCSFAYLVIRPIFLFARFPLFLLAEYIT